MDQELRRGDIEQLALSYLLVRNAGCTCDVRFRVTRCADHDPAHTSVTAEHTDACPIALRAHAPVN